MKSSSKRFDANQAVTGWQPIDFALPQAAPLTVSAEEILALFKGDLPMRPPAGLRGPSDLHPRSNVACVSWLPSDLPPFEMPSAEDQTANIKMPVAKAQARAAAASPSGMAPVDQEMINQLLEEAQNTRTETERLITDARLESQEIIRQAQEEAELRLQQAYEQGKAQAEAELASSIQAAQSIIQELVTWRDQMLAQSEPAVIAMVQDIATSLFGSGIVVESKVLQEFLAKSLTHTRNMGNLRIFVSPIDATHIEPDWRDYQTAITGQRMQIIASDNIKSGGCYIEAEMGSVDARIDTRLDAVMSVFNQNAI